MKLYRDAFRAVLDWLVAAPRFAALAVAALVVLVLVGLEGLAGTFRPLPVCALTVPYDFAMKYARAQLQLRRYSPAFVNALRFDGYSDDDDVFFVRWSVPIDNRTTDTFTALGNGCGLDHFDGPGTITYTPLGETAGRKSGP